MKLTELSSLHRASRPSCRFLLLLAAGSLAAVSPAAAAKRVPRQRPAPVNAASTHGLYTVGKQGSGVYYRKGYVLGVGINVIEADLANPGVRVGAMIARGGIGSVERFGQMIRRSRPAAAITGTFFGIRDHIPTGDLVIDGK